MINIIEREFTNTATGVTTDVYKCNAGDAMECRYVVEEKIFFQNNINGISFTLDHVNNKIDILGYDWIFGGLLNGDDVKLYHAGVEYVQNIVVLTGTTMELDNLPTPIQQGDFLQIEAWSGSGRKHVNLFLNHAFENNGFTIYSHIDNEKTSFEVDNISSTGVYLFNQFGKRSGQFKITNVSIENITSTESGGTWEVLFTIINSAIYAPQVADPLLNFHLNFKIQFFRVLGNPNTSESKIDTYFSNIGWFGMGYKTEPADGAVSIPIANLNYNAPSSFQVHITGAPADLVGYGASYIPNNDAYFKNKLIDQSELGMTSETTNASASVISGSNPNDPSAPQWEIELLGTSFVAGLLIVDLLWTPNFGAFMDNLGGDRLFYVWLKVGNTNHLVYSSQLTKEPLQNEEITPTFFQLATFEEQLTAPISNDNARALIEDNLAMLVEVPIVQNTFYQSIKSLVYLEKTGTGERVVFQSQTWNLANNVFPNGFYVGNFPFQTANNLSSGSTKNNAVLSFTSPVGANYSAIINYPFLINWRYWVGLIAMFPEFYPNQNNNWLNFALAGYEFYMETQLLKPDGSYAYCREPLTFFGYDSDVNVSSVFVLKTTDDTPLTHVVDGILLMEVTHTGTSALSALDLEFTIEPKEGLPRWQVSTEYPENNANNPLSIISNVLVSGVVTTVVSIDTSKLNILNGISFTAEIKGLVGAAVLLNRHKESLDYIKLPSLNTSSQSRCEADCCVSQLKIASLSDTSPGLNDTTAIYYNDDGTSGTLTFTLWNNTGQLMTIPLVVPFAETPLRYSQFEWRNVLQDFGSGCYDIRYTGSIAGIPYDGVWGNYQLIEYSCDAVRSSVRIRTFFDKYFKRDNINFKGTGLYDDVRVEGVFGSMQPIRRSEILMYGDDYQRMVNQEIVPEYKLESKLVEPKTAKLLIKNLLIATDIFISEYNPLSPDFIEYENVILSKESSIDIDYSYGTRGRGFTISFSKKERNERVYLK